MSPPPASTSLLTALQLPCCLFRSCVQDNDMVMHRGHALEWFSEDQKLGFTKHWSRVNGCDAYRCGHAKPMGGWLHAWARCTAGDRLVYGGPSFGFHQALVEGERLRREQVRSCETSTVPVLYYVELFPIQAVKLHVTTLAHGWLHAWARHLIRAGLLASGSISQLTPRIFVCMRGAGPGVQDCYRGAHQARHGGCCQCVLMHGGGGGSSRDHTPHGRKRVCTSVYIGGMEGPYAHTEKAQQQSHSHARGVLVYRMAYSRYDIRRASGRTGGSAKGLGSSFWSRFAP